MPRAVKRGYKRGRVGMSTANRLSYERSRKAAIARYKRNRVTPRYTRSVGYYGRYSGTSPEMKFHDLDINDAIVASDGTAIEESLNIIPQDNTESGRIGRKIVIKSISARCEFFLGELNGTTASFATDSIRFILYLDTQTNGAAATVLQILKTADWQSFNNLANKGRFRTLKDWTVNMHRTAGGGNGTTSDWTRMSTEKTLFLDVNIPIEFDDSASTGAITTIRSNNIGLLMVSRANQSGFNSKWRLRYTDV